MSYTADTLPENINSFSFCPLWVRLVLVERFVGEFLRDSSFQSFNYIYNMDYDFTSPDFFLASTWMEKAWSG